MRVAYYYHVPLTFRNGQLYLPGHFGKFIDALAAQVEELILLFHEATPQEDQINDYPLTQKNIKWVNWGVAKPAWHRFLFHKKLLGKFMSTLSFDVLIVRAPCALAPFFKLYLRSNQTLFYMVVGDYKEAAKHWKIHSIKSFFIKYYLQWNDHKFKKAIANTHVFTNVESWIDQYKMLGAKSVHLFYSTTLTQGDFWEGEMERNKTIPKILYTGRIDEAKGIFDLILVFAEISNINKNIELHIAGWDMSNEQINRKKLEHLISQQPNATNIYFHGKVNPGEALNNLYRASTLFVLPSYHEGFPRSIWEAMANKLPVITTPVGSIPFLLKENTHALFTQPGNKKELTNKILALLNDEGLYNELMINGYELAKTHTLDSSVKDILYTIKTISPNE